MIDWVWMFSYLSCRARQKQPHSWYFRDVRKEITQYIRECSIFSLHFQTAGWIGIYHTALTQHFPLLTLIRTVYSWRYLSQLPFKMYLFNDDKRSYNIYLKFQFSLLWHQYDCPLDSAATSTMRRMVQFENLRISATSEKVFGN